MADKPSKKTRRIADKQTSKKSDESATKSPETVFSKINRHIALLAGIASLIALYISWRSYQESFPRIKTNEISIVGFGFSEEKQTPFYLIQLILSNDGGKPLSIIGIDTNLIFDDDIAPTPTTPSLSLEEYFVMMDNAEILPNCTGYKTLPPIPEVEENLNILPSLKSSTHILGSYNPSKDQIVGAIFDSAHVSADRLCRANKCEFDGEFTQPDFYVYSSKINTSTNSMEAISPIAINAGETVVLSIRWYVNPAFENLVHAQELIGAKDLEMKLETNLGNQIKVNLLSLLDTETDRSYCQEQQEIGTAIPLKIEIEITPSP